MLDLPECEHLLRLSLPEDVQTDPQRVADVLDQGLAQAGSRRDADPEGHDGHLLACIGHVDAERSVRHSGCHPEAVPQPVKDSGHPEDVA